ncbi:hypothetical protein AX17_005339 [Amanita inopinata Kibby_2008]|nr:hypothetical protein AX17_005339 [Amanita inopinata Kibby_2008]
MSKVAHGTFTSSGDGKFTGEFTEDDTQIKKAFKGIFSGNVPPFTIPAATIKYDNPLDGMKNFYAGSVVGSKEINIILEHGLVITGGLETALDTAYPILGSGKWYAPD